MQPLFSICIPTYNRAGMLVESLRSAMSQVFTEYEVIVRDNASTDDTMDVIRSYQYPNLRYLRNEQNLGGRANFELVANDARGEFVIVLQDDDLLHPEFLSRAAKAFSANPDVVLYAAYSAESSPSDPQAWHFYDRFLGPELPVAWNQAGARLWPGTLASVQCLLSTGFWFPVLAIRREAYVRHLPWDGSLGNAADRYFTGCIASEGPVAIEGWVGGVSRRHPGQLTEEFGDHGQYLIRCARKLLDFYESRSIDWGGPFEEWLGLLSPDRRKDWLSHVLSLAYPREIQERVANAVALDTGQNKTALLSRRVPPGELLKHYAHELTPPVVWRCARHLARKFLNRRREK